MPYDYSDAPPPRGFDLIPAGEIVTVSLHIRPGGVGEDQMFKRSKDGGCEMLECEFTVIDGQYKKRKLFEYWVLEGTTDGHAQAAELSRGTIKAIIDSAYGLDPKDKSDQARAIRTKSLGQLEGIIFMIKVGIEKGGPKNDGSGENFADKNVIAAVITKNRKEWKPIEQQPFNGGNGANISAPPAASNTLVVERPKWADE
jgi:hypothetical protein